jgi:hypothetical protein
MIPGITTKISEGNIALTTTIFPKSDLVLVTDTTSTTVLTTIQPPYAGFSGICIMVNRSGQNITTLTTGNILTAVTIGADVAVVMAYSKANDVWYVGALA